MSCAMSWASRRTPPSRPGRPRSTSGRRPCGRTCRRACPRAGVEAAVASVYAVTTQERCSRPPSSPTMVGIAVPTIMLSSMASMHRDHQREQHDQCDAARLPDNAVLLSRSAVLVKARPRVRTHTCPCSLTCRPASSVHGERKTAELAGRQVSSCQNEERTLMSRGNTRQRIQDVALELFANRATRRRRCARSPSTSTSRRPRSTTTSRPRKTSSSASSRT